MIACLLLLSPVASADGPEVLKIASDPENPKRFLALYDTASPDRQALMESLTGGLTWHRISVLEVARHEVCFTRSEDGKHLLVFAAAGSRLLPGGTWSKPVVPGGYEVGQFASCSTTEPGVVHTSFGHKISELPIKYHYTIFQSTDSGSSWRKIAEPQNFASYCPEMAEFFRDSFIFSPMFDEIISSDKGRRIRMTIRCKLGRPIFAISADFGKTWRKGELPSNASLHFIASRSDVFTLFAVTNSVSLPLQVFVSRDGGQTWAAFFGSVIPMQSGNGVVLGRTIRAERSGTKYYGWPDKFRWSLNSGSTWNTVEESPTDVWEFDALQRRLFLARGLGRITVIQAPHQ